MKEKQPDSNVQTGRKTKRSKSLTDALGKNEEAKELVLEAAAELSLVNTVLKLEITEKDAPPGFEIALEKSEAVENKVQEVSEKLAVVNLALQDEVRERHLLEEQLATVTEQGVADRHSALHDVLTGLPNRTLFDDRLEHGIAHAQRRGWPLAVMFVDLDDFKTINDTHGHDAGDAVLRAIASRLKASTRGEDTVSRVGGDEFLYLAMEVHDEDDVASIAKHLIDSIHHPCDVNLDQLNIRLSVKASVGIALYPKNGVSVDALIKSADTAMYEAKRAGSGYSFAP